MPRVLAFSGWDHFYPAGLLLHDPFPDHTITSIVHQGTGRKSPAPPSPVHRSSVSEVTYPERIVVGATVETKWGNAIIKVINSDGSADYKFPGFMELYNLSCPMV